MSFMNHFHFISCLPKRVHIIIFAYCSSVFIRYVHNFHIYTKHVCCLIWTFSIEWLASKFYAVPIGAATGGSSRTSQADQEVEENKTNLLQQRDTYYATVRKPQPVPATLERIPGTCQENETGILPGLTLVLSHPLVTCQIAGGPPRRALSSHLPFWFICCILILYNRFYERVTPNNSSCVSTARPKYAS